MTARARRTFWGLVVVAVVATGGLSVALDARAGPATALVVASSALVVVAAGLLALRILLVVGRVGAQPPEADPLPP